MPRILSFLLITLFLAPEAKAQLAEISGQVYLPAVKREQRTFRGKAYRNRLSASSVSKERSQILQSSFIDVIVSAHPLSFIADTIPLNDAKILQKDAKFIPRVVPVTVGTAVQFINKDNFFHNVFSISPGSEFNIGRRPTNVVRSQVINHVGEIKLFCDIHAQMNAFILCLDTPYFTRVEPNGRYLLSDLPDGDYEIRVYHPDLTGLTERVSIKDGASLKLNFTLAD